MSFETLSSEGAELDGAKCELTNDEGTWFVVTPGSTTVHRSNKDLRVICKKQGIDAGTAAVVSRTKGNMFGNILLGGGVGAIIDHNNGSAYEYPPLVQIFMGRENQKIDAKTQKADGNSQQPKEQSSSQPTQEQSGGQQHQAAK